MINYIIRRVLLMFPTLIGITFLVFMLLAASPGGIGAGLLVAGGGAMQSQSGIAIQKAKLEDRYGLNENVAVQYVRWLARISPIKLGQRDLVSPNGELIVKPRPVPEPAMWAWFADRLPEPAPVNDGEVQAQYAAMDESLRARHLLRVNSDYIGSRAAYTASEALLRDALKRYVEAMDRPDLLTSKRDAARVDRLENLKPDRANAVWAEVEKHGKESIASFAQAGQARELLIAGMRAKPYPEAGVPIIPGVVSIAWPDLGVSFSRGQPVIELIKKALPVTLLLNLIAFPIIYFVAIPSGMLAAIRKGGLADVGLGIVYVALFSIPAVLAGVLCLGFLANPDYANAFPTAALHSKESEVMTFLPTTSAAGVWSRGWLLDAMWHMVLPVVCLVYGGFALLSKQTRAAMLENFNADYVRTAKAKGVSSRDVVLRHVFRNSLLPLITMFVTIFPAMLAGSVVIERIFSVPGMGSLLIDAINQRDRELILANTTMIAIVNLSALLLADILYALADPRIAYK